MRIDKALGNYRKSYNKNRNKNRKKKNNVRSAWEPFLCRKGQETATSATRAQCRPPATDHVTWRHRSRDQSIPRMPFPIGAPLERSLQPFSRYSTPTHVNERNTHTHTNQQGLVFLKKSPGTDPSPLLFFPSLPVPFPPLPSFRTRTP